MKGKRVASRAVERGAAKLPRHVQITTKSGSYAVTAGFLKRVQQEVERQRLDAVKRVDQEEDRKRLDAASIGLGDSNIPSYTGDMTTQAARLEAAAEILRESFPAERVERALQYLVAADAARETTSQSAKGTPRLKWENDRQPDENPAAFAWRAYAAEASAGKLHRGVIHAEDPPLYWKLTVWLRSHSMPEEIDIPTKPEWNTRQLAEAGAPVKPGRRFIRTEQARLYDAARYRAKPT
jgi:hypothetical protein